MRTARRLRAHAPYHARRRIREFDLSDATVEPYPEPPPEAVFDRLTGPYGPRFHDEET